MKAILVTKQMITTSEYIEVRTSLIHGSGIYAKKDIPKETRIIEYIGEKISRLKSELFDENPEKGIYLFELNKKYDLDGNVEYNTARFINHSCNPNCYVEIKNEEIWILSINEIKKGEELTYDYGFPLFNFLNYKCNCGTKKCVGYIVERDLWPKMFKKLIKMKKKNLVLSNK
ncbi:SET domain-containing protein-lysine N-methyltransferase [Candidatus Woesearchaeota archaeon]|nr:SET domain-containing protein-lysine N-methyltransferase [Candidatus Woesearchaeota archaeon]